MGGRHRSEEGALKVTVWSLKSDDRMNRWNEIVELGEAIPNNKPNDNDSNNKTGNETKRQIR